MYGILNKLVKLLLECLLIRLALELISFLEDGAHLDVFYVNEGELIVAAK